MGIDHPGLRHDDLVALLEGACFFASGGGGPSDVAKKFLAEFEGEIRLTDPGELRPQDRAAVVSAIGSPEAIRAGKTDFKTAPVRAFDRLAGEIGPGKHIRHIVPFEIGTCGLLTPLIVAHCKGEDCSLVDADGAGRAVPQMVMSTFAAVRPPSPFCFSNDAPEGKGSSCQGTLAAETTEDISAMIRQVLAAKAFGEIGALATWAMRGDDVGKMTIPGTVTRALEVGRLLVRWQQGALGDPLNDLLALLCETEGYARLLGSGSLVAVESSTTAQGFDLDIATVDCRDRQLRLLGQNENLLALDSKEDLPAAMAPDPICCVNEDGHPLSNTDLTEGNEKVRNKRIYVVGIRARQPLREPTLLRHFLSALFKLGYRGRYRPIEDR